MNSILKSPGRTSILPMFNSWEAKNIKPHQYRALFINSVSSKKTDEECDLVSLFYLSQTVTCRQKILRDDIDSFDVLSSDNKTLIQDKKQKKKAIAVATQIFSNKKRTSTKTNGGVVFCDWNGCAYVDVDAKKFFEKIGKIKSTYNSIDPYVQKLFDSITNRLKEHCPDIFLFSQISSSNTSFHFVFSFNIDDKDKTIETFKFLAETSQILVRLNFIELGKQVEWLDKTGKNILQQIIDAPEVLDNCSKNPYQPLFISENPIVVNEKYTGYFRCCDDDDYNVDFLKARGLITDEHLSNQILLKSVRSKLPFYIGNLNKIFEEEAKYKSDSESNKQIIKELADTWALDNKIPETNNIKKQFSTNIRFCIARTIKAYVGGDKTLWREMHNMIVEKHYIPYTGNRNYTIDYMKHQFDDSFDSMDIRKANFSILEQFGIYIKRKNTHFYGLEGTSINNFQANEVIKLPSGTTDNCYLSYYFNRIIEQLKYNKVVYIKAGCGVGKSSFYRKVFQASNRVMIISHLNSIRDGVYNSKNFVSNDSLETVLFDNHSGMETTFNYIFEYKDIKKKIREHTQLPNKMIINWDTYQLIKENYGIDTVNKYIKCVDESHNLITTANYRNKASKIRRQKEGVISSIVDKDTANLILCSGTPQYEWMLFDKVYSFEFLKEDPIKYEVVFDKCKDYIKNTYKPNEDAGKTETISSFIAQYLLNNSQYQMFDRTILFSNVYNKTLPHYISQHKPQTLSVTYFNKANCDKKETSCGDIIENNILNSDIMVSTIFGSQGIEIKNNIDTLLAIFIPDEISKTDFIQTIHRFRNVKNIKILFLDVPNVIPEADQQQIKNAIDALCNLSESERNTLGKYKNQQLTQVLMKNNINFQKKDVQIAYLYRKFIETDNCSFSKLKKFFEKNNVDFEVKITDEIQVPLNEQIEATLEVKKAYSDYINKFQHELIIYNEETIPQKFAYYAYNSLSKNIDVSENSLFDIGDCTGFDIYKPHAFLTTYNTNKLSNDLITMRNIKEEIKKVCPVPDGEDSESYIYPIIKNLCDVFTYKTRENPFNHLHLTKLYKFLKTYSEFYLHTQYGEYFNNVLKVNFDEHNNIIRRKIYSLFTQYKQICGKKITEQININRQKESYKDYEGDNFTILLSMIPDMFSSAENKDDEAFYKLLGIRELKYSAVTGAPTSMLKHLQEYIHVRDVEGSELAEKEYEVSISEENFMEFKKMIEDFNEMCKFFMKTFMNEIKFQNVLQFIQKHELFKPDVTKTRKGKAKGQAKGKAKNIVYVFKENNDIKFDNLTACYEYYKEHNSEKCAALSTFIRKKKWCDVFDKVKITNE